MTNVATQCPQCGRGGLVHWARVKATGQLFLLCTTCEAVWHRQDDIGSTSPQTLSDYLKSLGVSDDWWEIRVLSRAVQPA